METTRATIVLRAFGIANLLMTPRTIARIPISVQARARYRTDSVSQIAPTETRIGPTGVRIAPTRDRFPVIVPAPSMVFRAQRIGKYRSLSALGSRGFGTVYLAEDTWIDKKVAIKVPHKQNLDFSELVKEPRLLASMSHPNIVTVLTAERQNNTFFIVMEYVPGDTLEQIIERECALVQLGETD